MWREFLALVTLSRPSSPRRNTLLLKYLGQARQIDPFCRAPINLSNSLLSWAPRLQIPLCLRSSELLEDVCSFKSEARAGR